MPEETLPVQQPATKSRNKYPKGFSKDKGTAITPPLKKKSQEMAPVDSNCFEMFPETGSLADALKLIEEAGFDD